MIREFEMRIISATEPCGHHFAAKSFWLSVLATFARGMGMTDHPLCGGTVGPHEKLKTTNEWTQTREIQVCHG